MDVLGVHQIMKSKKQGKRRCNNKKEGVKVVYISSPMKVKTCASKFRALVQELTGRESDVARLMEMNGVDHSWRVHDQGFKHVDDYVPKLPVVDPYRESPTSSGSLFEPFDDVYAPHMMHESFTTGLFSSNFLNFESSQADLLRSFDRV